MKKKLAKMLIIVEIIIIFITSSYTYISYAQTQNDSQSEANGQEQNNDENDQNSSKNTKNDDRTSSENLGKKINKDGAEAVDNMMNNGEAKVDAESGSRMESLGETASSSDTLGGILASMGLVIPSVANALMSSLAKGFQTSNITIKSLDASGNIVSVERQVGDYFLIEDLVMNRYTLFNINYLDLSANPRYSTIGELRKNVAVWYYSLRNIAIIANCLILIYIGIRMAISTVVADRVKYKKMFINWVTSVVLIFIMHYIIAIMFAVQGFFTDMIGQVFWGQGFEEKIMQDTYNAATSTRGWDMVGYTITIWVLVYYQLKFFLMYFKRTLSVGFLFEISPLITITYAIDAVKDGKSQVYNKWFKEMTFNIFIQVIHAVTYGVFILSAGEIAKEAPIMGALLIISLSRTEKAIEKNFKLSSRITKSNSLFQKFKQFKIK